MSGNSKHMIAFPYFGSKFSHLDWLYQYIPKHKHWVDVFGGSFVVTLNKRRSEIETVNDLHGEIVNFFMVLREYPKELLDALVLTPYSREEYECAWFAAGDGAIERARKFYVRQRQSYGSMGGQRRNKGWLMTTATSRSEFTESVSRWLNGIDKLPEIVDRLKQLQIENKSFRELMPALKIKEAFMYLDPPYDDGEVRTGKNEYLHDFSKDDHVALAELAHHHPGFVMISGYQTKLMNDLYGDWHLVKARPHRNTLGNTSRQECLWLNYHPSIATSQLDIFQ